MVSFWNERYSEQGFAYGKLPNEYFREKLANTKTGSLLLPAEGEGRNAVYAALLGWQVTAFDLSEAGKAKAMILADNNNVFIEYDVCDFAHAFYPAPGFDAVALIFAHFAPALRATFHSQVVQWLKPGGYLIVEAFAKQHTRHQQANPAAGGPQQSELLYSLSELVSDFKGIDFIEALETETQLSEGPYHAGAASVVRLFGTKKTN
jgi:hypothetical protein